MKISTIASITVIGGTMAGSLMLSPVGQQPAASAASAPSAVMSPSLPMTGSQVAILRIKHATESEAIAVPTEIYEQYVAPPAPAPAPAAAPARVFAARPATP